MARGAQAAARSEPVVLCLPNDPARWRSRHHRDHRSTGHRWRRHGEVLPHEETLPKPKSDRLDLLRATNANLSPIWGLSLTPGMAKTYATDGAPDVSATDDDGVRHELWVIDDEQTVDAIRTAVSASPVVIADGHHRYETSLAFQRERRAALGGPVPGDFDLIMALVVELSADELAVGPRPPGPVRVARRDRPGGCVLLVVRSHAGRRIHGQEHRCGGGLRRTRPRHGVRGVAAVAQGRYGRSGRFRPGFLDGGPGPGRTARA